MVWGQISQVISDATGLVTLCWETLPKTGLLTSYKGTGHWFSEFSSCIYGYHAFHKHLLWQQRRKEHFILLIYFPWWRVNYSFFIKWVNHLLFKSLIIWDLLQANNSLEVYNVQKLDCCNTVFKNVLSLTSSTVSYSEYFSKFTLIRPFYYWLLFYKKKKLFSHWQCLCTNVSLFDQCEFCRLSFSWGSLQYFLNIIKTLFSFTDYKNKWILLIVILSAYFAFLFISSLRSYEIHSRIIGKYSAKMNKQMTPNPTIKM